VKELQQNRTLRIPISCKRKISVDNEIKPIVTSGKAILDKGIADTPLGVFLANNVEF